MPKKLDSDCNYLESRLFSVGSKPAHIVVVSLRHRQSPSPRRAHATSHWARPLLYAVLGIAAIILAGVLFRIGIGTYNRHLLATGLTADTQPVTLAIATEQLSIPANMLRHERTRKGGAVESADLVILWPSREGYSDEMVDAFREGTPNAPVIYATITARDGAMDATARLDAVYARFFTGKALPAPEGLTARALADNSGYGGEIVYFVPDAPRPFVARCLSVATPEVPATCLRDINIGRSLSLLYRFNRDLLPDWKALDAAMRELGESFIVR